MAERDMDKPWYKDRTIQAALIGAGALLLISIVGWLIPLYTNGLNGSSEMITSVPSGHETNKVVSSEAIPSGPNTPGGFSGSRQSEIKSPPITKEDKRVFEPEEKEADVNRPVLSPIIRIRERTIMPEEEDGKVDRVKKPELVRGREEFIEPEDSNKTEK